MKFITAMVKLTATAYKPAEQHRRACDSHVIHELAVVIAAVNAFKMAWMSF
jgi:hypothetical protein